MVRRFSTAALAALLSAACGKSEDTADRPAPPLAPAAAPVSADMSPTATPSPPPAAPPEDDRCELEITGEVEAKTVSRGGLMAIGADYWLDDAEKREAAIGLYGPQAAEGALAKDPLLYIVQVNCGQSGKTSVNLAPAPGTRYKDVPYGQGDYPVVRRGKPGNFQALVSVNGDVFGVDDGKLHIAKWDQTGIAGTFELPISEAGGRTRTALLKGHFDFKCPRAKCMAP